MGTPFTLARVPASAMPSSMRATSRTSTGWPPTSRTTISPNSAGDSTRPRVRIVIDCAPCSTRPPGTSLFCACRARATSLTVRPCARRRSALSVTLIWRWRPPVTRTCPTPSALSSCRRSTLSAYSVMSRRGLSAVSATVSTGCASGSRFSTVGCVIVRGSSGRMRFTLSRTSCVAMSAFFSSLKLTTTCETPSDDVEVSVSIPLMVLTASSTLSVTSLSTCSGAAPGRRVVTTTVGKSTAGN